MRSAPVGTAETIFPGNTNAIRDDARGAATLLAHQMLGSFAFATNPTNTKTATFDINGTNVVVTFVTSIGSTANNVLIGASAAATLANLLGFLQNPSQTTTTQVAASAANQALLGMLWFAVTGTTLVVGSMNKTTYLPLTSFSASTTATSDSYTGNTMALYVEAGTVNVGGTQVKFAGGITPTVTAPSSHPRIDVLTLDSSATLAWTTGTENASPAVPTYPANKVPICELYNVVSETLLYDNDNQVSGGGYIQADVRPMVGSSINLGAITASILPATDNTYALGGASFEWTNGYFKTNVYVNGLGVAITKFGGTGTDGALSITSGTTTITAGSAYVEKNYTSVSVTSTGNLAISSSYAGTLFAMRSQGGVTLTSSSSSVVNVSGIGGGIGSGVLTVNITDASSNNGIGGSGGGSTGGVGTASTPALGLGSTGLIQISVPGCQLPVIDPKSRFVLPGGTGSAGGSGYSSGFAGCGGGSGGQGGGALYIECAGAYNFTTGTINASGAAGGSCPSTTYGNYGGGGGGGGGGNVLVLYGTLTADTGTYNVAGGAGGTGSGTSGSAGASGSTFRGVNLYHA